MLRDDNDDIDEDENPLTAKRATKKPTSSRKPAATQPIADSDIEMNEDQFAEDFEIDKGGSSRTKASSRCLIVSI